MERKEIFEKVCNLADKHSALLVEKMTENSVLIDDMDMDSLDRVELVMDCEKEFEIQINDETYDTWKTLGDVVTCVEQLVNNK